MFYLYSPGGIAVISDQSRATERVRHEPLLNTSIPAKATHCGPKQRIHNKIERHTHFTNATNVGICVHFTADTNLPFKSQSYDKSHSPLSDMTSL